MMLPVFVVAVPFLLVLGYILSQGPLMWLVMHRCFPGSWADIYVSPVSFLARRSPSIKAAWYRYLDSWAPNNVEEDMAMLREILRQQNRDE
jgi:hypothetical protein